jgi:hypothetical protein
MRRAANFAIDRSALTAEQREKGPQRPTDRYLAPGMPGFRDVAVYPLLRPDVGRAQRLAGAGHHHANLLVCD